MSLAHNGHSQLSDSNTGERDGKWMHNGLSAMGKQAIAEMNRLGIMVDVSHPSKESMMQTVALSKAPIIASHSAARALADHSRNMDDEQLQALKKNGGVIQTVAFNSYVKIAPPPSAERTNALAALRKEFGLARPAVAAVVVVAAAAVPPWLPCQLIAETPIKNGSPRSMPSTRLRRVPRSRTLSITLTTSSN